MHPIKIAILLACAQCLRCSAANAQGDAPAPVVWTTEQDHRQMLEQLGITKLRPGRGANADSANPANYDEAQANPDPTLPALLTSATGAGVDSAEAWWSRRSEIVELLEREIYGRVPEHVPPVRWEIRQTRDIETGGLAATQQEIVGVVDNSSCPDIQVTIAMSLTLPKALTKPVPVLLSFGWTPFEMERFNFRGLGQGGNGPRPPSKQERLLAAGWGCAVLNPSTVQDDAGGWQPRRFGPAADPNAQPTGAGLTRGIIGLTNRGQPRRPEEWGALRAWAWGASRALDYFATRPELDAHRVGIAGVSRYGKAALVALAFDQRLAMGLIASSGAGGTKLFRRNFGESLENLAGSGAYHWMAGNYLRYAADASSFGRKTAADLPVDAHMTLALCAPRLTFISHGVPEQGDAHWLDHQGSFMAAIAAQPVFRLLGAGDLGRSDDYLSEKMPEVNVELLTGSLAWRQHSGGHTDEPNVEHFIRWAEQRWNAAPAGGREAGQTSQRVAPGAPASAAPAAGSAVGRADDPESTPAQARAACPSLKEAVGRRFQIGVGVGQRALQVPEDAALLRQHFQVITPENCMKPQNIHPAENRWDFSASDQLVAFARTHQLGVVGHCLLWAKDDRTDRWMMVEDDQPVTRPTLLRRIETHVQTVVERYADTVTAWDVVNEALGDTGEGLLRDSVYSRTTDLEFIVTAFRAARAKAPAALLIYNDYNCHQPAKRDKLIALLDQLRQAGVKVDAVGMQGHFELGDDGLGQMRDTLAALQSLGVKVAVSELDVDVVPRGRWWAEGGKYRPELARYDPYREGLPSEVQQRQAEYYGQLFKLLDEYRHTIVRVSFWNLHDGQSWLNDFPWRRVNHPLLFDRQRQPKPAYFAVCQALGA